MKHTQDLSTPTYRQREARNLARGNLCARDGCGRGVYHNGLCARHEQLARRGLEESTRRANGSGWITKEGYHKRKVGRRTIAVHREVMEQLLGRALHADESVHHRNGDPSDNRPENLELRVRFHGRGQSIEDLIAWAREILGRYDGGSVPASAADRVARLTQNEQDKADDRKNHADREQDGELREKQPQDYEDDAENEHGSSLAPAVLST